MNAVGLHGFTGCQDDWSALGVQAIALLGHESSATSASFSEEVRRIAAIVPPRCHLIGYSMGARLALATAIGRQGSVQRLTLISGSPGLRTEEDRRARRDNDLQWVKLLDTEGIEAFVDAWEALPLWASQGSVCPERLQTQRQKRLARDPAGLARSLQVVGTGTMPSLWEQLSSLQCPVHMIAGELDPKFSAIAKDMGQALPNARLTILPGTGHNPLIECPETLQPLLAL